MADWAALANVQGYLRAAKCKPCSEKEIAPLSMNLANIFRQTSDRDLVFFRLFAVSSRSYY